MYLILTIPSPNGVILGRCLALQQVQVIEASTGQVHGTFLYALHFEPARWRRYCYGELYFCWKFSAKLGDSTIFLVTIYLSRYF